MAPDPAFATATEVALAIRTGRASASEVLDALLGRIARHNPALNAIVTLDEAGARQRAQEADEALRRGEPWGPLHGLPVTIHVANTSFTLPFNVTGNPVVAMPVGRSREGLPIGVQVVGRRWHDMELLSTAALLAGVAPPAHPPGYASQEG